MSFLTISSKCLNILCCGDKSLCCDYHDKQLGNDVKQPNCKNDEEVVTIKLENMFLGVRMALIYFSI